MLARNFGIVDDDIVAHVAPNGQFVLGQWDHLARGGTYLHHQLKSLWSHNHPPKVYVEKFKLPPHSLLTFWVGVKRFKG